MIDDAELYDYLKTEFESAYQILADVYSRVSAINTYIGVVQEVFDLESNEAIVYGPGAVSVIAPDITGEILIVRPYSASVNIPKPKDFVVLESITDSPPVYVYTDIIVSPPRSAWLTDELYEEVEPNYGFVDKPTKFSDGGFRLEEAYKNPGKHKIVASTKEWIIGAREAEPGKTIDISTDDDWTLQLNVGNNGKIEIGYRDPQFESTTGGTVDIKLFGGESGGSVEIESGSAATEKMVLGETLKGKLEDLIDKLVELNAGIQAITVPTAVGVSGTPVNTLTFSNLSTDLTTIKGELTEILSTYNKNN